MEMLSNSSKMDSYLSFVKTEDFEFHEYGFMNPGDTALEQMIHTEKALSLSHPFESKSDSENSLDDYCCFDSVALIKQEPDSDYSDYDLSASDVGSSSLGNKTLDDYASRFISVELENVLGSNDLKLENVADKSYVVDNKKSQNLIDAAQPLLVTVNGKEVPMQNLIENCFKTSQNAFVIEEVQEEVQELDSLCPSLFTDCNDGAENDANCNDFSATKLKTRNDLSGRRNNLPAISSECSTPERGTSSNDNSNNEKALLKKRKSLDEFDEHWHKKAKGDKAKDIVDEKKIKDAVEKVKLKMEKQKETKLKEKEMKSKDREMKIWEKARLLSQKIARESAPFVNDGLIKPQKISKKFKKKLETSDSLPAITRAENSMVQSSLEKLSLKKSSSEMFIASGTPLLTPPMTPSCGSPDVANSPASVCSTISFQSLQSIKKNLISPTSKGCTKPIPVKHPTSLPISNNTSIVRGINTVSESCSSRQVSLLKPVVAFASSRVAQNPNVKAISPVAVLKLPGAASAGTAQKSLLKTHCIAESALKKSRPTQTSLLRASNVVAVSKTSCVVPAQIKPTNGFNMSGNSNVSIVSKPSSFPRKMWCDGESVGCSPDSPMVSKMDTIQSEKVSQYQLELGLEIKKECISQETDFIHEVVNENASVLTRVDDETKCSKEKKKRINLSEYKNRLMEKRKIEKSNEEIYVHEEKVIKIEDLSNFSYLALDHNYCLRRDDTTDSNPRTENYSNQTSEDAALAFSKDLEGDRKSCINESASPTEQPNACVSSIDITLPVSVSLPDDGSSVRVRDNFTTVSNPVAADGDYGTTVSPHSVIADSKSSSCESESLAIKPSQSNNLQISAGYDCTVPENRAVPGTCESNQSNQDVDPAASAQTSSSAQEQLAKASDSQSQLPASGVTSQDHKVRNSLTLGYILSQVASKRKAEATIESTASESLPSDASSVSGTNNSALNQGSEPRCDRDSSSERETRGRSHFAQRSRRNYRRRSSSSDSSSRSPSQSPVRKRSYRRFERNERSRSRSRSRSRFSSHGSRFLGKRREQDFNEGRKWPNVCREERHVIFIGGIPSEFTKNDLTRKFEHFGEILSASVHHPKERDSYGFVKFSKTEDADRLKSEGHGVSGCENFQFSYGGRRGFCKVDYADLDDEYENWYQSKPQSAETMDFDSLLKETLKLQKKNCKA